MQSGSPLDPGLGRPQQLVEIRSPRLHTIKFYLQRLQAISPHILWLCESLNTIHYLLILKAIDYNMVQLQLQGRRGQHRDFCSSLSTHRVTGVSGFRIELNRSQGTIFEV